MISFNGGYRSPANDGGRRVDVVCGRSFILRRLIALIAVFSTASILLSAGIACAEQPKKNAAGVPDPSKEVVLRVNKKEYTRENLNTAIDNYKPMMSFHSSTSQEKLDKIKQQAIDAMINEELVYGQALELKAVEVPKEEIDAEIENKIMKRLPKGRSLDDVLKDSKMTRAELREHFRKQLTVKHFNKLKGDEVQKAAEGIVNDAYMKDYYQKNIDKFKEPEKIHMRSILIKADPSGGRKVWEASFKKAQDLVKQAKAGADFAELARKYSEEDVIAKNGGDMGWQHRGSFLEEIDAQAATMKVGDISPPVMTMYGYYVLKLEGKQPSALKKYEELNKDNLRKELVAKEKRRLGDEWIKGLRDAAKIDYVAEDVKPKKEAKAKTKGEAAPAKKR